MNDPIRIERHMLRVFDRINTTIQPKEIILFGSRANGTAKPNSDFDLLILYDGPLSKRDVKVEIRRLFPQPDFSMDLFVLSSSEFNRQKNIVSTLGYIASREGVVYRG